MNNLASMQISFKNERAFESENTVRCGFFRNDILQFLWILSKHYGVRCRHAKYHETPRRISLSEKIGENLNLQLHITQ